MTRIAKHTRKARYDLLRWGLCFALVVAAHGGAVMALMRAPEPGDDFAAGAPVTMIELPEAPAALSNPPSELPPGPVEPETEQTPPREETAKEEEEDIPKEQIKPPEQMAEVTLPTPEPKKDLPKPEPVAEEKPATALPSTVALATPAPAAAGAEVQTISTTVRRWETALVAHIERYKRYPAEARAHGARGFAKVAFTIDRDGRVRESHILESSGSPDLDHESLAMLTRAQPMPKPPGEVKTSQLSFVVPVRFDIR